MDIQEEGGTFSSNKREEMWVGTTVTLMARWSATTCDTSGAVVGNNMLCTQIEIPKNITNGTG